MKTRFGMVVAIEIEAINKIYPNNKKIDCPVGFELYYIENEKYELYILKTGMGEIKASAGVQFLATAYNVKYIFNYGVVGGLKDEMGKHKVCVVDRVVHYKYDCSEFMDLKVGQVDGHDSIFINLDDKLINSALKVLDLEKVTCASGDKFVASREEKEYLSKTFEGDICDMESAGIVLACELNNIPCLLIKAVSDGLSDGADGFYNELNKASLVALETIDKIINMII